MKPVHVVRHPPHTVNPLHDKVEQDEMELALTFLNARRMEHLCEDRSMSCKIGEDDTLHERCEKCQSVAGCSGTPLPHPEYSQTLKPSIRLHSALG